MTVPLFWLHSRCLADLLPSTGWRQWHVANNKTRKAERIDGWKERGTAPPGIRTSGWCVSAAALEERRRSDEDRETLNREGVGWERCCLYSYIYSQRRMAAHLGVCLAVATLLWLSCADAIGQECSAVATRHKLKAIRHLKRLNKPPVKTITVPLFLLCYSFFFFTFQFDSSIEDTQIQRNWVFLWGGHFFLNIACIF